MAIGGWVGEVVHGLSGAFQCPHEHTTSATPFIAPQPGMHRALAPYRTWGAKAALHIFDLAGVVFRRLCRQSGLLSMSMRVPLVGGPVLLFGTRAEEVSRSASPRYPALRASVGDHARVELVPHAGPPRACDARMRVLLQCHGCARLRRLVASQLRYITTPSLLE